MKRVIYTSHLELRLALRSIPVDYPRAIYAEPDELYWDSIEGRSVAIRRLPFRSRIRPLMIAFDESSDAVSIVTIPPIAENQIYVQHREMRIATKIGVTETIPQAHLILDNT